MGQTKYRYHPRWQNFNGKIYLLGQYMIAFPDGHLNHVTGCKPLSDTYCTQYLFTCSMDDFEWVEVVYFWLKEKEKQLFMAGSHSCR